jgi:hypothetical protein
MEAHRNAMKIFTPSTDSKQQHDELTTYQIESISSTSPEIELKRNHGPPLRFIHNNIFSRGKIASSRIRD